MLANSISSLSLPLFPPCLPGSAEGRGAGPRPGLLPQPGSRERVSPSLSGASRAWGLEWQPAPHNFGVLHPPEHTMNEPPHKVCNMSSLHETSRSPSSSNLNLDHGDLGLGGPSWLLR